MAETCHCQVNPPSRKYIEVKTLTLLVPDDLSIQGLVASRVNARLETRAALETKR